MLRDATAKYSKGVTVPVCFPHLVQHFKYHYQVGLNEYFFSDDTLFRLTYFYSTTLYFSKYFHRNSKSQTFC